MFFFRFFILFFFSLSVFGSTSLEKEFFEASISGNLEKLNDLMKNEDLKLDFQDENGRTAFHHLAEKLDLKTMQFITSRISTDFIAQLFKIKDKKDQTFPQVISVHLVEEFEKELTKKDLEQSDPSLISEKLLESAEKEDIKNLIYYLKFGDIKVSNSNSQHTLHILALKGNFLILQFLLGGIPELEQLHDLKDVNSDTWRDILKKNHPSMYEQLEEVDQGRKDLKSIKDKKLPVNKALQKEFFEASISGDLEKLSSLMKDKKLQFDFQDHDGKTVFHHLAEKLYLKTLSFITDNMPDHLHKSSLKIKDKHDRSWPEVITSSLRKEVLKEVSLKEDELNSQKLVSERLTESIRKQDFVSFLAYWRATEEKNFLNEKNQNLLHVASEVGNIFFINFIQAQFSLNPLLFENMNEAKDINGQTWRDIFKKRRLEIHKDASQYSVTEKTPYTLTPLQKEFFEAVVEKYDEKKITSLMENKDLKIDFQYEDQKTVFHHLAKDLDVKALNFIAQRIDQDISQEITQITDHERNTWPEIFQISMKKEAEKTIILEGRSEMPSKEELFKGLMESIKKQDMKSIIYYLKMKVDPRSLNEKNQNSLHLAAYTGNGFITQFFLNQLDLSYPLEEKVYEVKDETGKTWLDIFKEKRPDLVKLYPDTFEGVKKEEKAVGDLTEEEFRQMLHHIGQDFIDIAENVEEDPKALNERVSPATKNFLSLITETLSLVQEVTSETPKITNQLPNSRGSINQSSSFKKSDRRRNTSSSPKPLSRTSYYASDVKRFFQLVYENEYKDVSEIIKTINPKARDKHGQTALYYTEDPKMIKLLIKQGISVSTRTKRSHNTALHLTSTPKKAEILLEKQKDLISASNYEGKTPLYKAVENDSSIDLVKLYLKYGASIDHESNLKEIPIFEAVRNSNLEMIQYLIKSGSPLDYVNNRGETILHLAAHAGNIQVIIFLTSHMKGLLNHINIYGDTAMDIIKTTYPELTSEIIRLVKSNNQKLANIKRPRRSPSRVSVKK